MSDTTTLISALDNGARRDHSSDPRGAAADTEASSQPGEMVGLRARGSLIAI